MPGADVKTAEAAQRVAAEWPDIWGLGGAGDLEPPDLDGQVDAAPEDGTGRGQGGGSRSDLTRLARGGMINLVGAFAHGLFGFLLVLVVTRGLRRAQAGVLFEAIALFTILSNFAELGADDGLVRMIPRFRTLHRSQDLRRTLRVGLWPVLAAGTLFGILLYVFAPELSRVFVHGNAAHAAAMVPYLHVLAPFLPLSAVSTSMLSATRGFANMVPTVVVDNFGKPGIRPILMALVLAAGLAEGAIALSWAAPIVAGLLVAIWALRGELRKAERRDRPEPGPARPARAIAVEFWRFSVPRAIAAVFGVTLLWLDTLLLGGLRSTGEASVYTAASRYLLVGFFAIQAIQLVLSPMISGLVSRGDHDRTKVVYQTATQWLIALTWPVYLTLAIFAPLLLRVFGPGYTSGQTALVILSVAMLVSAATGPVMSVLLMAGKSTWTLYNSMLALALNVGLNLLLIPHLGMEGAAIAWLVSILANNALGVIEVAILLRISPLGAGGWIVIGLSALCFGGIGLATRSLFGLTPQSFLAFGVVATAAYLLLLYLFRGAMHLSVLREAMKARSNRDERRARQLART